MKLNITKYIIAAAILFLAAATPIEAKAQYAQTTENAEWKTEPPKMSNPGAERAPFTDITHPPAYAPPPEGGDGQKLPIRGGLWVLIGLTVAYGIVYRKREDIQ